MHLLLREAFDARIPLKWLLLSGLCSGAISKHKAPAYMVAVVLAVPVICFANVGVCSQPNDNRHLKQETLKALICIQGQVTALSEKQN